MRHSHHWKRIITTFMMISISIRKRCNISISEFIVHFTVLIRHQRNKNVRFTTTVVIDKGGQMGDMADGRIMKNETTENSCMLHPGTC
jgi:hypothetical protein